MDVAAIAESGGNNLDLDTCLRSPVAPRNLTEPVQSIMVPVRLNCNAQKTAGDAQIREECDKHIEKMRLKVKIKPEGEMHKRNEFHGESSRWKEK